MKKGVLLLTSLLLLAGCALPMPLKIASWALDGISYLATEKSIAENGLSIIAKKDCSLMRPLKGEQVCIGNGYDIAQVLKNAVQSAGVNDQEVQTAALAEFKTAAGPSPERLSLKKLSYDASEFSDAWRFMRQRDAHAKQAEQAKQTKPAEPEHLAARKAPSRTRMKAVKAAAVDATDATGAPAAGYDADENTEAWAFIQARNGSLAAAPQAGSGEETQQAQQAEEGGLGAPFGASAPEVSETADIMDTAEPAPIPTAPIAEVAEVAEAPLTGPDAQPSAGLYYVIGSLTRLIDLDRLTQRRKDLESLVVVTRMRDRPLYREVVGPFKRNEKQAIRRMIEKAGVAKAWLTFIDPHSWTLASPAEISALTLVGAQTASLR